MLRLYRYEAILRFVRHKFDYDTEMVVMDFKEVSVTTRVSYCYIYLGLKFRENYRPI